MRKLLMLAVLLVTGVLSAPLVQADTINVTWTAPTTRTDGTPLAASEIGKYEVFSDGAYVQEVGAGMTTLDFTMTSGQHCLQMRTVDTDGRAGPLSAEKCFTILAPPNQMTINVNVVPE